MRLSGEDRDLKLSEIREDQMQHVDTVTWMVSGVRQQLPLQCSVGKLLTHAVPQSPYLLKVMVVVVVILCWGFLGGTEQATPPSSSPCRVATCEC